MQSCALYFDTGSHFLTQPSYSKPAALASRVLGVRCREAHSVYFLYLRMFWHFPKLKGLEEVYGVRVGHCLGPQKNALYQGCGYLEQTNQS